MKRIQGMYHIVLITSLFNYAAPDCIDDSWELHKKVDYKEFHLQSQEKHACYHDCYHDPSSKIIGKRGYCTGCGHYRIPRPYIIVSSKDFPSDALVTTTATKKARPLKTTLPLVPKMLYGPPVTGAD